MSPERAEHIRVKSRIWAALDRAIRQAGLDCEAIADGITIAFDDDTDYEPDAVVNCGPKLPPDATAASNPLVLVAVLSRSRQSISGKSCWTRRGPKSIWRTSTVSLAERR